MSGRARGLLRPGNIVIAVLAVAVVVASVLLVTRPDRPATGGPVASVAAPTTPVGTPVEAAEIPAALWVGDSYTAGIGGMGKAAYAQIICARVGWACNLDAQGSTGFTNDGAPEYRGATTRIGNRLPFNIATYKADVILIDGGRNDLNKPAEQVGPVMDRYIRDVRAAWPAAKLVIIVPAYMSPKPYEIYRDLLDYIDATAADTGATVIDPIAEGWWRAVDVTPLQFEDRVHPNAAGNAYIARVLGDELVARGIAPAIVSPTAPVSPTTPLSPITPASGGGL